MLEIENIENDFKLKLNLKYDVEEYYTLDVFWKKWYFQWKWTLCFNKELLLNIWLKNFRINDYDSNWYLEIYTKDNLWHYYIELQIWWSYEDNYVKIKWEIDNISFKKLIKYFEILKN